MFSRRHPYLFFMLCFFGLGIAGLAFIAMIVKSAARTDRFEVGEKIGIVEVTGVIADSKKVLQDIKRFRDDDAIRAIVIRIDSPGGAVGPSQEIYRELRRTAGVKHVVASLGSVAASGGYYIAAGAEKIVASPGTLTGSIGVILGYTNFEKVLDKIGLTPIVIKSGAYKDIGSPVREMSDAERQILQNFVEKIHAQFIDDVAKGRKMEIADVAALADGRIFTGQDAESFRLVDRMGNLEDAVQWAADLAGVKGKIQSIYSKRKFSLGEFLDASAVEGVLDRALHPEIKAEYRYHPAGD